MNFGLDFLSNFLATMVAGVLLAILVDRVIARRQANEEKKSNILEQGINKCERIETYLSKLYVDIIDIYDRLEMNKVAIYKKTFIHYISLRTDYWEILENSGELTEVLNPDLVYILSIFFSIAKEINEIDNRIMLSRTFREGGRDETYLNSLLLLRYDRLQNIKKSTYENIEYVQDKNKATLNQFRKLHDEALKEMSKLFQVICS